MANTITPEKLDASGTEQGKQRAILFALNRDLRTTFPLAVDLLYHVPNGGFRGDAQTASIAGNNLKLMGAKSGVPDLHLPLPYCGYASLYIEVKLPKERLSQEQANFIPKLVAAKNFVAIMDDWQMAVDLVHAYLSNDTANLAKFETSVGIADPKNRMANPKPSKSAGNGGKSRYFKRSG